MLYSVSSRCLVIRFLGRILPAPRTRFEAIILFLIHSLKFFPMSKVVVHFKPREWQLISEQKRHETEHLPNDAIVPNPNRQAWPYRNREPAVQGTKSAQHKRNLDRIAQLSEQHRDQLTAAEAAEKAQERAEKHLRERVVQNVKATAPARLCDSPTRFRVPVTCSGEENEPKERNVPKYLVQQRMNKRRAFVREQQLKDSARASAWIPKGLAPMPDDLRRCTLDILEEREAELIAALNTFPFASSCSLDRRKGLLQRELEEVEAQLRTYRFPVVLRKHHDPKLLI